MVAFEPCLDTGDGSENTTIHTIPYLYHTELPTLSQISGASASAIDDLNKAIRESLYCFGVLANAASAS